MLAAAALTACAGAHAAAPRLAPRAALATQGLGSVHAYVTIDPLTFDLEAFLGTGARVTQRHGALLTAVIDRPALEAAAAVTGVLYIETGACAHPMLDVARPETGIQAVHSGSAGLPYKGAGVVVGIVDKGFDYNHAAFRAADGSSRIRLVWEQAAEASDGLSAPEPYGYGVELTGDDIALAGGDVRGNSHGTHVASIAAGADHLLGGSLDGMAPEADIVLVSMLDDGGGNVTISDAISYIFAYADRVDKPCVVNLSLGSHSGPHDGSSTFDVLADAMQGPGRLIVGSAGNHRTGRFHVGGELEPGGAPLRSFIECKQSGKWAGDIEVWGSETADGYPAIEVSLLVVKTSTGDVAERVQVYPSADDRVSLGRNVSGTVATKGGRSPLNGKDHVLLQSQILSVRTGYAVAVEVTALAPGRADIWADNTALGLTSLGLEGYAEPGTATTICEIGGTARRILTVGSYTTRAEYTLLGESQPRALEETVGGISSFSSAGPTADGRMKPQVTAPGCLVSAAVSEHDNSGTLLPSAVAEDGGRLHMYGYMQGTSMSSPMMAGTVATWLEAYPMLTPEELVEVVAATSRSNSHSGDLSGGSNDWGHGMVDALGGLRECLRRGSGISDVTAAPEGTARMLADGAVLFTADARDITVEVYNVAGACVHRRMLPTVQAGDICRVPVPAGLSVIVVTTAGTRQTLRHAGL